MIDDPDPLDEEFPTGDEGGGGGPAETTSVGVCPYCGEENEIALDAGGGTVQEYVEDCQVCCRPWHVTVSYDESGSAAVTVAPLEED
jgi:hypothetical protein